MTKHASAAQAPVSIEYANERLRQDREEFRIRSRRLQLAVGVANGGGFTAVGAKVLEALAGPVTEGATVVALIFPSAALFLGGLILAGVSIGWDAVSAFHVVNRGEMLRNRLLAGSSTNSTVTLVRTRDVVMMFSLEFTSGVLFAAGVAYPLVVLLARYVSDGGFSW